MLKITHIITSPYNDGEAVLKKEKDTAEFRKEKFHYCKFYYEDKKTRLKFETPEVMDLNLNQVYNQYRELKHIPSTEQIINTREKYGLSAAKMSELLGFGANTYSNYEKGEIPSEANGEILSFAANTCYFKELFLDRKKDLFKKSVLDKIYEKIEILLLEEDNLKNVFGNIWNLWNPEGIPDENTGYKTPNFDKFANQVLFFIKHQPGDMFATRLNKLLFYSDFLNFKQTCYSISGARYHANHFGTVPVMSQITFSIMVDKGYIDVVPAYVNDNGETIPRITLTKTKKCNLDLFTECERNNMIEVINAFKGLSTKELVSKNHEETAWKEMIEGRKTISYKKYAFDIKAV